MLDWIVAVCTTSGGLAALITGSDLMIAAAYFSIPFSMLWVFRRRREDLPFPMLWVAFVLFIFACGMTHFIHAAAAMGRIPLLEVRAAVHVACAVVSVATAILLTVTLPKINLLPSPERQRRELAAAVEQATREKDALLVEVNHRVGNQLAKLGALVRQEMRNTPSGELSGLLRIQSLLEELGTEHHRLSAMDYHDGHPARSFIRRSITHS